MVNPRRIRDRIEAIADPKARAAARVEEVQAVVTDIVANRSVVRGTVRFEFQRAPQQIIDTLGNVIGIALQVRLFRGANEFHVDGSRWIINPPTLVPDGTFHDEVHPITGETVQVANFREDPREALFVALEQSIATLPAPERWRP